MATDRTCSVMNRVAHGIVDHDDPGPLKIAIVGAGIGGLTAAIALRRQGHEVALYEQSSLANETGAAVHLPPNSNGLLRRWGIYAENFGANTMSAFVECAYTGALINDVDLRTPNEMWQHPWHLVHRVALHENLKKTAMSEDGLGKPATLHASSKVTKVDGETGRVTFDDGKSIAADVVIGADGIYSKTRSAIDGGKAKLFSSGKAAFRFLLPRSVALNDPVTRPLVERNDTLYMWYDTDRRVVMYPCNYNETLNFVLMHPDTTSHATPEWAKEATVNQVLKIYEDFYPPLKQLISKVDPAELKVWQLLDMEKLSSWTKGKLALIGDAAHPFTPHQGQGASQAMEDSAALATVLPKGTAPSDVPERLRLYEKIRYDRAHRIQEHARQAGKDWIGGKPQIDMMAYTAYNFGHDEIDNTAIIFKKWLSSQKQDLIWRLPLGFGFSCDPPQNAPGRGGEGQNKCTFATTSIEFKTSRTYLETLLPTSAFKFSSPATVCTASVSVTTFDNLSYLGGRGYSECGLYIHGVRYAKKDGSTVSGTYLPVLFENLGDPNALSWHKLDHSKVVCDIDVDRKADSCHARCSWRGTKFLDITLKDLKDDDPRPDDSAIGDESSSGILTYKYIPATGEPGKADVEYACLMPREEENKVTCAEVRSVARSTESSLQFHAGDWDSLPTLHHVASSLAAIPIYEILSAKTVEGFGVPGGSSCKRIE